MEISCYNTFAIVSNLYVAVGVYPSWVSSSSNDTVLYVKRISTVSVWLPRMPVHPWRDEPICSTENRLNFHVSDSKEGTEINVFWVKSSLTFLISFRFITLSPQMHWGLWGKNEVLHSTTHIHHKILSWRFPFATPMPSFTLYLMQRCICVAYGGSRCWLEELNRTVKSKTVISVLRYWWHLRV